MGAVGTWVDRLIEGMVVVHEDRLWRVGLVNESRARLDPLTGKQATVTNRDKSTDGTESASFTSYGKAVNVSPNATMRVMDAGDMNETEAARYSRLTGQLDKEQGRTMAEGEMNVAGAPMAKRGARAKAVKAARKTKGATVRKAKSAGPKAPRKPKAEKTQNPCKCGCGEKTGGFFVPGHDARFKGMMLKIERGEAEPTIFPKSVRDQYKFVKRGEGYVTTTNYKGEQHKGYDKAAK